MSVVSHHKPILSPFLALVVGGEVLALNKAGPGLVLPYLRSLIWLPTAPQKANQYSEKRSYCLRAVVRIRLHGAPREKKTWYDMIPVLVPGQRVQ